MTSHERFVDAVERQIMPLVVELGYGTYYERYRELRELDRRPAAELGERRFRAFRESLEHAWESVPHYRETLAERGLTPGDVQDVGDLPRLPTLDKRTLVEGFPDRITSSASPRDEWRYRSTSGTAYRVMTVTDHSARQWRYAQYLRSLEIAADYRLGEPQTVLRTEACLEACAASGREEHASGDPAALPVEREWPPLGFAPLTLQETVIHARDLATTAPAPEAIDVHLRRVGESEPKLLRGMPIFLLLLARRLQATGAEPPSVERIVVQDSLAPPALKRELAETFGCPVRETYGSSELGSVAAEGDDPDAGLLVAPDLFLAEILDAEGRPVAEGELGIVTLSATGNRALPLLRYQLGDVGRSSPAGATGGQRLRIEGRVRETIPHEGGLLTAAAVYEALDQVPGLDFFQVVERAPGRLELRLVPAEGGRLETADAVAALEDLIEGDVEIRPRVVRSLRAEESGKFVFVKALEREGQPEEA